MKKSCFAVLMILICLSATLTGCSSSVAVPKDELKRKALDALKDEYSYANSFEFERDIYDESIQAYDMYYLIESFSKHSFTITHQTIRARSFYDKSSRSWGRIMLSTQDRSTAPNLSIIGTHLSGSSGGGTINIQLLSIDESKNEITLSIDANNLSVKDGSIYHNTHTLNRHQNNLVCSYDANGDDILIDLGQWDGENNQLWIRFLDSFGLYEMQYKFAIGNEYIFPSNGVVELDHQ